MAIVITPDEINALCPNSLPDAVIDNLICSITESMGSCAESSYPLCTATIILQYAICHLVESSGLGEIKSERAPNGSNTTYENHGGGEGLKSTTFGRLLSNIDTKNCSDLFFAPSFLFISAGNPAAPGCY